MLLLLATALASDRMTVEFSASQEHSCSQSWQTQSWSGRLWLEPGAAPRLGVEGTVRTISGSQRGSYDAMPPDVREEPFACQWKGEALADGSWRMTLENGADYACHGEFTLACTPQAAGRLRCALGDRVPPLLYLLGGGEEGLVLGEGLRLEVDDYGMGSPHRKVVSK